MGKLVNRLRSAVSSLGNVGAVANAEAALLATAASRRAVDALELRMAVAADHTLHAA
jgi:hypothetical protein